MKIEKRKRADGEEFDGKGSKTPEHEGGDAVEVAAPGDEEVEAFFAILRRIHVAVKYFRRRNGGRQSTAEPWSPAFKPEDFVEVVKSTEKSDPHGNPGLDLNSCPAPDERAFSDSI
ncbi:uncharacterized protein LOC131025052 [Salvia miltiorrhiza]|uniref:uncharacterized protein LOC131025052 n=1 Tax=Salvia miltiorrhiza TaxID=226208 RepID=UPI0025ACB233|nr:uncharacterized protein LOC131025052 [Salvia miltiorrhiza]